MNQFDGLKSFLAGRKTILFLFAAIIISLPIGYAPSSICLGIFCAICLLRWLQTNKKIFLSKGLIFLAIIYLWNTISYFWSADQDLTIKGVGRSVAFVVFPLFLILIRPFNKSEINKIFSIINYGFLCYAFIFFIHSTIQFIITRQANVYYYHELSSIFQLSAIYASIFYLILMVWLLFFKVNKSGIAYFSIFLYSIVLILLSSKTGIVVLVILSLLFTIKTSGYFFKLTKIRTTVLLSILASIFFIFSNGIRNRINAEKTSNLNEVWQKNYFGDVYPWTGTSIRLFQLRLLGEQIENDDIFFLGYGYFTARESLKVLHQKYGTYIGFHNYNYHNQYAQTLAETGIVGLLILLVTLFNFLRLYLTTKQLIPLGMFFVFFSFFFTESVLMVQKGIFIFILVYSLLFHTNFKTEQI